MGIIYYYKIHVIFYKGKESKGLLIFCHLFSCSGVYRLEKNPVLF